MDALEMAIGDFLAMGRRLQSGELTVKVAWEAVSSWYRTPRIDGAKLDEDGDMILVQWGRGRPALLTEPADLRESSDGDTAYGEIQTYIEIVRQVFVSRELEDESDEDYDDFDSSAVQMHVGLYFGAGAESDNGSNMWIRSPAELEAKGAAFLDGAFVRPRLHVPARVVSIFVDPCG